MIQIFEMYSNSLLYVIVTLDWQILCSATTPFFDFDEIIKLNRRSYALYSEFHNWIALDLTRAGEGSGIWKRGNLRRHNHAYAGKIPARVVLIDDLQYFVLFESS
jgi:hypothetical protein